MDSLRRSGVGVDSDDDLEGIHVSFQWFTEIHGVLEAERQSILQRYWTPTVEMAGEQESTPTTSTVEQPGSPRAHSEVQPAHSGASSEEQHGVEEPGSSGASNVEQPGPSGASNVERPGPSGAAVWSSLPLLGHVRRKGRWKRWKSPTESFLTIFCAVQAKSMRRFMELEKRRMEWQAEQVRKDDEREVQFLTFMKDVFSMFAPPPPVPYYPHTQPIYPFPPVPPPIPQNYEEEDDEE